VKVYYKNKIGDLEMEELEHGKVISVDTVKKTLIIQVPSIMSLSRNEYEMQYDLKWHDNDFAKIIGKQVGYVLSDDGRVVKIVVS
jgi:predicted RNA-binding protein YlqC (UPF0109 family)